MDVITVPFLVTVLPPRPKPSQPPHLTVHVIMCACCAPCFSFGRCCCCSRGGGGGDVGLKEEEKPKEKHEKENLEKTKINVKDIFLFYFSFSKEILEFYEKIKREW